MKSIQEIVSEHNDKTTVEDAEALTSALLEREDEMADHLRLAAINFGLYPQIVAKVLMDVGVGTTVSEEARVMINAQFVAIITAIQEAQQNGGPLP